ncbi:MAG: DUF2723 domain-containing protein [Candidatus Eisenbacteria bacterium]
MTEGERAGAAAFEIPRGPDRGNRAVAWASTVALLALYAVTLAPSVSFWDSGEFIAASYGLAVPHPPGTPLYVLIGRIFSLVPFLDVPVRVNLLSAVPGAFASFFLSLALLSIGRRFPGWIGADGTDRWRLRIGAGAGALFAGLGSTCWTNATEAEVYALSLLVIAVSLWLILRWDRRGGATVGRRPLIFIAYLLSLSIGIHLGTYLALPAFTLFVLLVDRRALLDTRLLALLAFVTLLGLTVHFYLPVRSHLNPSIDEANPETRQAFLDFLLRKQYKPNNPLARQASWTFQLNMYWVYFQEQYGRWLPLLGLVGAGLHYRKEKKTFALYGTLILITSLFLVFYMNFTDSEVRERDYFFAPSFFLWGGWMGFGITAILGAVRAGSKRLSIPEKPAFAAAAALLLALPVSVAAMHFHSHDRRGDLVAHDYAWNILESLGRDAIIFTNGDNDTFPLWSLQEVEGVRKDVRVVNLALLNTPWYIWQLKHLDPKVPVGYSDEEIEELRAFRTREGEIIYVKDLAIRDIARTNGWGRPIYFAVTVADLMGLDKEKRLRLEGLVFRLVPDQQEILVDVEKSEENLWRRYRYRGILDESGELDRKVAHDTNQQRLIGNYSAAFSRLAIQLRNEGRYEDAIRAMQMAGKISPGYPVYEALMGPLYVEAERWEEAEAFFTRQLEEGPESLPPYLGLAYIREREGRGEDAETLYRRGIGVAPNEREGYLRLCRHLMMSGDLGGARGVLREWLAIDPDDRSAVDQLREVERAMRAAGEGGSVDGG